MQAAKLRDMLHEALTAPVKPARQETEWTCGPASIRAIMRALRDDDMPEEELASMANATQADGTSPADLVSTLEKLGLSASDHEQLTADDLRAHLRDGHPIILDVDMWGGEHWVVVHTWGDDGFFRLMDPSSDDEIVLSPTALDSIRWAPSKEAVRGGIVVVPSKQRG